MSPLYIIEAAAYLYVMIVSFYHLLFCKIGLLQVSNMVSTCLFLLLYVTDLKKNSRAHKPLISK